MQRTSVMTVLIIAIGALEGLGQCGSNPFLLGNNLCSGGVGTQTINPNVVFKPFNLVICSSNWYCVGVRPDVTSPFPDRDIQIGSVYSIEPDGQCDFLVANGHHPGPIPTSGCIDLFSGSGASKTRLGNVITMAPAPSGVNWSSSGNSWGVDSVARVFEFLVTCPRDYVINVGPPTYLRWSLFDPGTNSGWRPRCDALVAGTANTPSTVSLNPGWHAVIIYKNGGPVTTTGSFSVNVDAAPNPTPVISSTGTLVACSGNSVLTINGSGFANCGTITVASQAVTPISLTSTSIQVPVGGNLLLQPGSLPISISTPPPGGGVTTASATIASAGTPAIGGFTPPSTTAGSIGFLLTISGNNFTPTSVVEVAGSNRTTTYLSSTALRISVTTAELANGGSLAVRVLDPCSSSPSPIVPFTIICPTPTIGTLSPPSALVGSGNAPIQVHGTGFLASSFVLVNGNSVSTTFVSSARLDATVPASVTANQGLAAIKVVTPCFAGSSNCVDFPIECPAPSVTSLSPSSRVEGMGAFILIVDGGGFCDASQVLWNGAPRSTTFVNTTRLLAAILDTDVALASTTTVVEVTSPAPGGGLSGQASFVVELPYPGTNEDFALATGLNGPPTTGPGASIKLAAPGDFLLVDVRSPAGTVNFASFYLFAEFFPTGNTPVGQVPFSYLSGTSTFTLVGPTVLGATPIISPNGNVFPFVMPFGLAGFSVLYQAIAITSSATIVPNAMLTDGHELRF